MGWAVSSFLRAETKEAPNPFESSTLNGNAFETDARTDSETYKRLFKAAALLLCIRATIVLTPACAGTP